MVCRVEAKTQLLQERESSSLKFAWISVKEARTYFSLFYGGRPLLVTCSWLVQPPYFPSDFPISTFFLQKAAFE